MILASSKLDTGMAWEDLRETTISMIYFPGSMFIYQRVAVLHAGYKPTYS